jgi:hypothetical protein
MAGQTGHRPRDSILAPRADGGAVCNIDDAHDAAMVDLDILTNGRGHAYHSSDYRKIRMYTRSA